MAALGTVKEFKLKIHVVDVKAPPLFSRVWLCSLYDQNDVLNVFNLNAEMHDNALSKLLNQYEAVFENTLGKLNNITGKLYLKNDANPVFCKAFNDVRSCIASEQVLTHYDPGVPLKLACDASSYGLGAVLSHVFPQGIEKTIAFVSRSLSNAEKYHAQIDKEALAIEWAVRKLHNYIFGQRFTIVTDHEPLTSILLPQKRCTGYDRCVFAKVRFAFVSS